MIETNKNSNVSTLLQKVKRVNISHTLVRPRRAVFMTAYIFRKPVPGLNAATDVTKMTDEPSDKNGAAACKKMSSKTFHTVKFIHIIQLIT
jgi:hypothetical protein